MNAQILATMVAACSVFAGCVSPDNETAGDPVNLGSVRGTVFSEEDNSRIADAFVLVGGNRTGTTTSVGTFAILALQPGEYAVQITKPFHEPYHENVTVHAGRATHLKVFLKPL